MIDGTYSHKDRNRDEHTRHMDHGLYADEKGFRMDDPEERGCEDKGKSPVLAASVFMEASFCASADLNRCPERP